MKRIYLKHAIAVLTSVFLLTSVLLSCKKDKLTEPETVNDNYEAEVMDPNSKRVLKSIKRFDNQLKQIRQGTVKDNSYIEIDSALWNMESLFNASFAFPDRVYEEKVLQELSFDIKVYNDNYLRMNDVSELYDNIISEVKNAYLNDGIDENKSLMSIMLKQDKYYGDNINVRLILITGRTAEPPINPPVIYQGPFSEGDCWYYGEYGGSCDDPTLLYDAAEILEDTINFRYANTAIPKDMRNLYVNICDIYLEGDEYWNEIQNDYYLFYRVNCPIEELYMDWETLNKYYNNELEVIFEIVPNDPLFMDYMPENPVLVEVNINGVSSYHNGNVTYAHQNYILYAEKCMIPKAEMELMDILSY